MEVAIIPYTSNRLYKPQCDLDPSWEEEDLTKATIRTINLVHAHTAAVKEHGSHFTAPGFCYVFPLLKQGMRNIAVVLRPLISRAF